MRVRSRYDALGDDDSRARADALRAWLRGWAERRLNSRLIDERRCIPPHVTLDLGNHGLFGLQVEPRWGGLGLRTRDVGRVLEQAAGIDLGLGTWLLTSMFPGVRPIASFGSESLKERLLRDLATGRMLAGYAQTEPGAGTHFPAMQASAVSSTPGRWRVSGDKIWIGNATWAGVLTVMAHASEGDQTRGISAFAVPTDRAGVHPGRELLSLGMRGMVQSEVSFRDVEVDESLLLGRLGEGLEVGVDSMSMSRFAIAATCIGAMKRALRDMARFAGRRSIATGRLIDHPVLRAGVGEAGARIVASEALLYGLTDVLDEGDDVPVELFAISKLTASEFLWDTADRLVQVLGSRGYDEANGAPQLLRDARVTRIFEGTTEALLAYVGGQALSPRSDLHMVLRDWLGADDLADALADTVRALRARGPVSAGSDEGGRLPRTWQVAAVGRVACWAVLAAALRVRAEDDASVDPSALDWTLRSFEEARRLAASGSPTEAVLCSPADVEKLADWCTAEVGDGTQTLPGEKVDLDPLLARDEPS